MRSKAIRDFAFYDAKGIADAIERKLRARGQWQAGWTEGKLRRKFPWSDRQPLSRRLVLRRLEEVGYPDSTIDTEGRP